MPDLPATPPLENAAQTLIAPAPRPPFAGALRRVWAFVLDCLLLYFVGRALIQGLGPALLALNPWAPWLGLVLSFLYFWLGNGPAGAGRTVGKLVMRLRAVDGAGQPLSALAAGRRAVLQGLGLFVFTGFSSMFPFYHALIAPPPLRQAFGNALLMLVPLSLAWLLALTLSIAIHPRRRGLHDLWAGGYVAFDPVPPEFFSALAEPADPLTQGRINKHVLFSLGFWALAAVALGLSTARLIAAPETRQTYEQIAAAQHAAPLGTFLLKQYLLPSPLQRESALQQVAFIRDQQFHQVKRQDKPDYLSNKKGVVVETTATLLSKLDFDGETIIAAAIRPHGAIAPADVNSPVFQRQVERLRGFLWARYQKTPAPAGAAKLPARRFTLFLYEPLQLLFNNSTGLRARVTGPADPAAGALAFTMEPGDDEKAARDGAENQPGVKDAVTTQTAPAQAGGTTATLPAAIHAQTAVTTAPLQSAAGKSGK